MQRRGRPSVGHLGDRITAPLIAATSGKSLANSAGESFVRTRPITSPHVPTCGLDIHVSLPVVITHSRLPLPNCIIDGSVFGDMQAADDADSVVLAVDAAL